jgi:Tol biopolymer transport system component
VFDSFSPSGCPVSWRLLSLVAAVGVVAVACSGAGASWRGISADARYVVFSLNEWNLVPGDTNDVFDVYVRDRVAQTTVLVSVGRGGGVANGESRGGVITPDGRFVVFNSMASNLVAGDTNRTSDTYSGGDVFVRDRASGTTERVSVSSSGGQALLGGHGGPISDDGRYVAFDSDSADLVGGDTNGDG